MSNAIAETKGGTLVIKLHSKLLANALNIHACTLTDRREPLWVQTAFRHFPKEQIIPFSGDISSNKLNIKFVLPVRELGMPRRQAGHSFPRDDVRMCGRVANSL